MVNENTPPRTPLIVKESLSQDVYNEILARLMDNRLVPGTMLNRRDVAKELGVSVAPVLEAMLRLELEGFLESIPRKGSFVKPIRKEDVFGQLMVREALECQGARLYCGKSVINNKDPLLEAAEELDNNISVYTPIGWEKEIQFHISLIDLANCPPLSQALIKTIQLGLFYRLTQIIAIHNHPENKHVELIKRLCKATPDEAEQLIRRHLRSGKEHLIDLS